ncbi:MAG: DUF2469 domain-containing protein [Actinomycetota bacterium]
MSSEDLEKYETEMELQLYKEYRDVLPMFRFVVETERRFYLCNEVDLKIMGDDRQQVYYQLELQDAWVWDMYRPARFVSSVRVLTFRDVNIEELTKDSSAIEELARELGTND